MTVNQHNEHQPQRPARAENVADTANAQVRSHPFLTGRWMVSDNAED